MSKQPPPAPTVSAVGPCPTEIQIVGRPGTGSLPSTIAPPDHPLFTFKTKNKHAIQLVKTLFRLSGCTGGSETSLFAYLVRDIYLDLTHTDAASKMNNFCPDTNL